MLNGFYQDRQNKHLYYLIEKDMCIFSFNGGGAPDTHYKGESFRLMDLHEIAKIYNYIQVNKNIPNISDYNNRGTVFHCMLHDIKLYPFKCPIYEDSLDLIYPISRGTLVNLQDWNRPDSYYLLD